MKCRHAGLYGAPTHTLMEARTRTQATVARSLPVCVSLHKRAERHRNEKQVGGKPER